MIYTKYGAKLVLKVRAQPSRIIIIQCTPFKIRIQSICYPNEFAQCLRTIADMKLVAHLHSHKYMLDTTKTRSITKQQGIITKKKNLDSGVEIRKFSHSPDWRVSQISHSPAKIYTRQEVKI